MSPETVHRLPVTRTYAVEHEGKTYHVTLRTVTGRVARVTRRDKSILGWRDYKLVDPDLGSERNHKRLDLPAVKAVVAAAHAGAGTLVQESYC